MHSFFLFFQLQLRQLNLLSHLEHSVLSQTKWTTLAKKKKEEEKSPLLLFKLIQQITSVLYK